MIRFLLLWLLSIVLWFSASAQSDSCYVRLGNYTGINTEGYQSELNAASCDLISAFPVPYRDSFRVFDYGYYRIPNDINGAESVLWDNALLKAKAQKPYCLLFGRKIDDQGKTTRMLLDIRLPASMFSSAEKSYIKEVLSQLATIDGGETNYKTREKQIVNRLTDFIKNGLNSNLFMEDQALFALGFDTLPTLPVVMDSGSNVVLSNLENYARINIKAGDGSYFNMNSIMMGVLDSTAYDVKIFMTRYDNGLDGKFNLAFDHFSSNNTTKVIVWLHFQKVSQLPDGSWITRIFFKIKNNIPFSEAQAYVENRYKDYNEAVYNGTYTSVTGENPHARDAPLTCLNPQAFRAKLCLMDNTTTFDEAIGYGVLDAILDNAMALYEVGKGIFNFAIHTFPGYSFFNLIKSYIELGNFAAASKAAAEEEGEYWQDVFKTVKAISNFLKPCISYLINPVCITSVVMPIVMEIKTWITDMIATTNNVGYTIGRIVGEVALALLTEGAVLVGKTGSFSKAGLKLLQKVEKVQDLNRALREGWHASKNINRKSFCEILAKGCFIKDTPVLMAGNPFRNTAAAYAMAAVPIISVPIQDVQLFEYAVAHKSLNASYGQTASSEDTYIIGKDPYTSDQQRSRDQYEINETDWYSVSFEGVHTSSVCDLAMHYDWIKQNKYAVDAVVNMNLPEQGISGPFKITSIKHIIPQKKPVDEDEADDYEYRPVTGLFVHESNDVWKIKFDDGTELGVTNNHPIYSVSKGDWQHAGHLEIGEEVLAKSGNAKVVCKERDLTVQPVYNLEVKDLHNFLVGDLGVVVHNGCWSTKVQKYGTGSKAKYQTAIDHCWEGHNPLSKVAGKSYFKDDLNDQVKLKKYITEAQGKGTIISEKEVERTVDGVKRKYLEIVRDMGENVGKLQDHSTDTNILTTIFDITDQNPIVNNAFPGLP